MLNNDHIVGWPMEGAPAIRWPVQQKHRAQAYFDMEKAGGLNRWNTLRALRVLRWWNKEAIHGLC
jgi:hypothetical protein